MAGAMSTAVAPIAEKAVAGGSGLAISFASAADREAIYRMRHEVYARELGQHDVNHEGRLTDPLDGINHYLVATLDGRLVGFVSITPPGRGRYSIDKYLDRDELPFPVDDGLFEIRILTVDRAHRGGAAAALLMYAALRWVEEHGATRIVIIGRHEVADLYARVGMRRTGHAFRSGAVTYELMTASIGEIEAGLPAFAHLLRRMAPRVTWMLTIPFERRPGAYHGGVSHAAIGALPTRRRRDGIVAADVLDAWFPPAPGVVAALADDPAFLAATSPTTVPTDLRDAIAEMLGVDAGSIAVGAGLSDLIYRCLPHWLSPRSRALLLEPGYGEYEHVVRTLVGCEYVPAWLDPGDNEPALPQVGDLVREAFDLVVMVDPNNPLGYRFDPAVLADWVARLPSSTRVWIDRTYAPFAGMDPTLDRLAARSSNLVVATSMSKAWALSGLRVGYLCGPRRLVAELARLTPPWSISRPAQAAALAAIADPGYYAARYRETADLREALVAGLRAIRGLRPRQGVANYVFCELDDPLDAASITERCAAQGVFLRAFPGHRRLRDHAIRVAVKDAASQRRMLSVIADVVEETRQARRRSLPERGA